jgi:hypothetical protein
MTNRRIAAGVLAILLCAGVNEAGAQGGGWRGWLDRLSGPGEFRDGVEVSVQVFCYGVPRLRAEKRPNTTDVDLDDAEKLDLTREWGNLDVACGNKRGYVNVGKTRQRVDLWRIAVGFELGQSTSAHNPLDYGGRAPGNGPKVTLGTFVPTIDFVPNAWLDVGAGAGFGWFRTAGFSTTWKPLIQPLRISVRPVTLLTMGSDRRYRAAGILQLKFNLTSFPGGFDAADFGATPGSWRVGTELLRSFSLVLDFGELLRHH